MLRVLLIALAIPSVGFGVSTWIISDINSGLAAEDIAPFQVICALPEAQTDPDLRAACAEFGGIELLQSASIYAGLLGIGIPLLFWLGSAFAGSHRARLAAIFPSMVKLVVLLLTIMVVLQGGILTYAAYIGESYAIEQVHYLLIGLIGFGAVVAAFGLISAAFSFGRNLQMTVTGKHVSESDAPRLYSFVRELADKLKSVAPKNIVVGLDPTYFVTNADIYVTNDQTQLTGETLFVSAPLSRLMTKDELTSVIGHELGHFRGQDTVYSMKFAPVYAGMAGALAAVDVQDDEGVSGLAKLPASAILSYMYEVFSRNERLVGRERELLADRAGAEASSPKALANALAKVSFYSSLWPEAQLQNINRLAEGKITGNLSTVFLDSAKYDVEHEKFGAVLEQILEAKIAHPTDTHPTFAERLDSLGIQRTELSIDDMLPPESGAIELIDGYQSLEENLTNFEHRLRVALGQVQVPQDEEQQGQQFLNILYLLAAAMVRADGRIDPNEIAVAEGIGQQLVNRFDPVDFRAACNSPDLPVFAALLDVLKDLLDEDAKSHIAKYVTEIATADGEISSDEQDLLNELNAAFNLASTPSR